MSINLRALHNVSTRLMQSVRKQEKSLLSCYDHNRDSLMNELNDALAKMAEDNKNMETRICRFSTGNREQYLQDSICQINELLIYTKTILITTPEGNIDSNIPPKSLIELLLLSNVDFCMSSYMEIDRIILKKLKQQQKQLKMLTN